MNGMHRGHKAADKREEIHFSLYSKKNTRNSPNKTMLYQEHINTTKQNILI
jgi:hypothetical protein